MSQTLPNQFADEEVRSSYIYPKKYKGPKPIADQIKAIANQAPAYRKAGFFVKIDI